MTGQGGRRAMAMGGATSPCAPLTYRLAVPGDAAECVALRGMTRENAISAARLRALGITEQSWGNGIRSGALPGHVCSAGGKIVGYCFGSSRDGEIVAAVLAFPALRLSSRLKLVTSLLYVQ